MITAAITVGMSFAGGFFLGFLLASIMSASFDVDDELESKRHRSIEHIIAWLESKQEELDQAA